MFQELAASLYERDFVLFDMLLNDADGALRWLDAVYINKSASAFPKNLLYAGEKRASDQSPKCLATARKGPPDRGGGW